MTDWSIPCEVISALKDYEVRILIDIQDAYAEVITPYAKEHRVGTHSEVFKALSDRGWTDTDFDVAVGGLVDKGVFEVESANQVDTDSQESVLLFNSNTLNCMSAIKHKMTQQVKLE